MKSIVESIKGSINEAAVASPKLQQLDKKLTDKFDIHLLPVLDYYEEDQPDDTADWVLATVDTMTEDMDNIKKVVTSREWVQFVEELAKSVLPNKQVLLDLMEEIENRA